MHSNASLTLLWLQEIIDRAKVVSTEDALLREFKTDEINVADSIRAANDYLDCMRRTFVEDKEGLNNWLKKHADTDFVKEPPEDFLGQNAIGHTLTSEFEIVRGKKKKLEVFDGVVIACNTNEWNPDPCKGKAVLHLVLYDDDDLIWRDLRKETWAWGLGEDLKGEPQRTGNAHQILWGCCNK